MKGSKLTTLLEKFFKGGLSPEEKEQLNDFYSSYQNDLPVSEGHTELKNQLWNEIKGKTIHARVDKPATVYRLWIGIAASLLVGVVAYSLWMASRDVAGETAPEMMVYETAKGQKRKLRLEDGSVVMLNALSRVVLPRQFGDSLRVVEAEGEVFFEVSPDASRPFVVQSPHFTTRVLGTSFNIKAGKKGITSVAVASGKVEVHPRHSTGRFAPIALTANMQASYKPWKNTWKVGEADLETILAWKDNTIIFENTALIMAIEVLENWYDVRILLENEGLAKCRVTGKYQNENLENVLESFGYILGLDYDKSGTGVYRLKGENCKNQ